MSKLHGFRRGEETIHITHLPTYKKPVLLVGNGYCSQKIASFDSEEAAEGFCKMLGKWLMVENEDKLDSDSIDIDKAVEHYEGTLATLKGIDLDEI